MSTLADDGLYWAAFSYERHCLGRLWNVSDDKKKAALRSEMETKIEGLYARIQKDYPDGDMVKRLPKPKAKAQSQGSNKK